MMPYREGFERLHGCSGSGRGRCVRRAAGEMRGRERTARTGVLTYSVLLSCLLLFCFPNDSFAQTWARTYGDDNDAQARSVLQTTDGGYVVAGPSWSLSTGELDFWILKLDAFGDIAWEKTYGRASWYDQLNSIQQTADDGYVVAGYTSDISLINDFWVLKLDVSGNVQWEKTYGGAGWDEAWSIQQTVDGGYIVVGSTDSFGAGSFDFWVLKLDASGTVTWQKTYGGSESDGCDAFFNCGGSIQQTSDGGYVVAGLTQSFGEPNGDVWVLKLSPLGVIEWENTYGDTGWEDARSIQQTSDGGFVAAGYTTSFGAGDFDVWVLKLSSLGVVEWEKTYGDVDWEDAYSIQQTTDGGYVVAGLSFVGAGQQNVWVLKLDASGNPQWQKTYGGVPGDNDEARSIQQTTDGGFVVAGWTETFSVSIDNDCFCNCITCPNFWVLRLDANGDIAASCTFIADTAVEGVDSSATVTGTTAAVSDTIATPADTTATVADTAATVLEWCSTSCAAASCSASVLPGATVCQGTEQTFTGTGAGEGALAFEWDFDYDGVTFTTMASGPAVGYTYPLAGSFTAALRVTDSCADLSPQKCLDTIAITVNVNAPAVAYDAAFAPAATLAEACGDGDLLVEPGEEWQATVQLYNPCVTANNVKADLTINAGSAVAATICNNPGTYGNILAGKAAQFTYSFVVDSLAVCVNDVTFDVTGIVSDEGAYASEIPAFAVQVGQTTGGGNEVGTQFTDPLNAASAQATSDFAPAFTLAAPAENAALSYTLSYAPIPGGNEVGTTGANAKAKGATAEEPFAPSFTLTKSAASAVVSYTLTHQKGEPDLTNCTATWIVRPDATTVLLKNFGVADAQPYDVPGAYTMPGTYSIRLEENCGNGSAEIEAGAAFDVTEVDTGNATDNVEVALIDPSLAATVVKDYGAADPLKPIDVTAYYTGLGTHRIRLSENAGGTATVTGGVLDVTEPTVTECDASACACSAPPLEPSAAGSPDPLLIPAADQLIVEDVENETGYVVYEEAIGTWYGTPSQGCLWGADVVDLGATVQLDYPMAAGDRWVVVSSANASGESSAGMDSVGAERNAQPGWPATGPCP